MQQLVSSPIVISTWDFGLKASEKAGLLMSSGGTALDAIEEGIKVVEDDVECCTVGYGSLPDRTGVVTLDASIMNNEGQAGSVAFLQGFRHAISVARLVMEKSPHVMLVGQLTFVSLDRKGAEEFALKNGFQKENLLTPKMEEYQKKKLQKSKHPSDTVTVIAMDKKGTMAIGCSTGGLGMKMHGRVGDSPIIGSGIQLDKDVGACGATGVGEIILKSVSSFLVVELMRNGQSPENACKEAIKRISEKFNLKENPKIFEGDELLQTIWPQIGLIAMNKKGQIGAFALQDGFEYSVSFNGKAELFASNYLFKLQK